MHSSGLALHLQREPRELLIDGVDPRRCLTAAWCSTCGLAPMRRHGSPRRATRLVVRAFTEAPDGKRTVISHMVKRVRGEVARLVLQAGGAEHPDEVAEISTAGGVRIELSDGALNVIE